MRRRFSVSACLCVKGKCDQDRQSSKMSHPKVALGATSTAIPPAAAMAYLVKGTPNRTPCHAIPINVSHLHHFPLILRVWSVRWSTWFTFYSRMCYNLQQNVTEKGPTDSESEWVSEKINGLVQDVVDATEQSQNVCKMLKNKWA